MHDKNWFIEKQPEGVFWRERVHNLSSIWFFRQCAVVAHCIEVPCGDLRFKIGKKNRTGLVCKSNGWCWCAVCTSSPYLPGHAGVDILNDLRNKNTKFEEPEPECIQTQNCHLNVGNIRDLQAHSWTLHSM